jgi:hypothetical protein
MSRADNPLDLDYAFRVVAGATTPAGGKLFSEYGQFGPGQIDKRCILQTRTWVDTHGIPHALVDMTPEYRSNVLAHLRQTTPRWVNDAYATDVTLTLYGAIAPQEASREIAALAALPPGWADHTPLGLALHHLNGTSPEPLTALPPVSRAYPSTAASPQAVLPATATGHTCGPSWTAPSVACCCSWTNATAKTPTGCPPPFGASRATAAASASTRSPIRGSQLSQPSERRRPHGV